MEYSRVRQGETRDAAIHYIAEIIGQFDLVSVVELRDDLTDLSRGDFNIPGEKGPLFEAIISKGLVIPKALQKRALGSNLAKDKRYDQILIYPQYPDNFTDVGGVLDFYGGDHQALFPGISLDFTFQISDHLPLWVQVNTDIESLGYRKFDWVGLRHGALPLYPGDEEPGSAHRATCGLDR